MGNCSRKIQQVFQKRKTPQSKIGESTTCPRCGQLFPPNTTYSSFLEQLCFLINFEWVFKTQQKPIQRMKISQHKYSLQAIRVFYHYESHRMNKKSDFQIINFFFIFQKQLNFHIDTCLVNSSQYQNYIQQQILFDPNFGTEKNINIDNTQTEYFWAKVPVNGQETESQSQLNMDTSVTSSRRTSNASTSTKYRWEKRTYSIQDINMSQLRRLQPKEVQNLSFEKKQIWFREKCELMRIPWTQGADWIRINPDNVLLNSMLGIQNCCLHKEVKIQIVGDKVNDAGGLLREWIHLCMKEILHPNTGMFVPADTNDVCYKINKDADHDEHIIDCFRLLGKIIGKALFERITMNTYFDRSFINYILGRSTQLEDIFFYDNQLYNSWKFLQQNQLAEDDFIDVFAVYKNVNGNVKTIELVPNGEEVLVNNSNKDLYIEKQIQYQCIDSVKIFLDAMCEEIYKVIPKQYISVFEPYEFEMILNGVPFINLEEWKQNTEYAGSYNQSHKVVQWFWSTMDEFDQNQLSKFLQYCTGSSRTPVEGFKKLESNRGNYAKFQIKSVPVDKKNPYPKAHTCFNRLELPEYKTFENVKMYLKAIVDNDLEGVYGLE